MAPVLRSFGESRCRQFTNRFLLFYAWLNGIRRSTTPPKPPCRLQGAQDADGTFSSRASCRANRNPIKGAFPKNYVQLPVMNGILNWEGG